MVFQYILEALNGLILKCGDGERISIMCARHARSAMLNSLAQDYAIQCALANEQLRTHAREYGGDTERLTGGSLLGKASCGRLWLKGMVYGYDDQMLFKALGQALESLLERYRDTLDRHVLPDALHAVVERQRFSFRHDYDHLCELRTQVDLSSPRTG
ncbi:MAG TPA: DUF2383 domain-containing protein [Aquabacterium sp.]|uniref:DUF2383 domain-containing protein n=1 Tax=Aquabacterium sp. TaxID=1872578 RepID=UPI002E3151FA|nr:DUF2383 domain-containing protein [Aquabacterium sp.]HEX5357938.1 DUF2383 domain-containing protein [Aquabacterium sp.]